jgi:RNA polymerase sigma factor (TIGR02999 family)
MTSSGPPQDVTGLLTAIGRGESAAAEALLPVVYEELRRLARAQMAGEPGGGAGQTLQPTALVHEAYLRLVGERGAAGDPRWNGRGHFFGAAALAMRRILIERARRQAQAKRGGGRERVELSAVEAALGPRPVDLIALDEALDRLQAVNVRQAQVVMLRFFAGLSVEAAAAALEVSEATVKNDWAYARAWLFREVSKGDGSEGGDGKPTEEKA